MAQENPPKKLSYVEAYDLVRKTVDRLADSIKDEKVLEEPENFKRDLFSRFLNTLEKLEMTEKPPSSHTNEEKE